MFPFPLPDYQEDSRRRVEKEGFSADEQANSEDDQPLPLLEEEGDEAGAVDGDTEDFSAEEKAGTEGEQTCVGDNDEDHEAPDIAEDFSSREQSSSDRCRPPRVWPVLLTIPIFLAITFMLVEILNAPLALWRHPQLCGWLNHALLLLTAVIPVLFSRQRISSRLGLLNPNLPGWSYPVIAFGTIFTSALGVLTGFFIAKLLGAHENLSGAIQRIAWPYPLPRVLLAVAAGISEELLFRGYIQRRLLERWTPWRSILVTAALFAVLHGTPRHILTVLPDGIWLGVVAWRTGSVLPAMLCHMFVNGYRDLVGFVIQTTDISEGYVSLIATATYAVGAVCFCVSVWVLSHVAKMPKQLETPETGRDVSGLSLTALQPELDRMVRWQKQSLSAIGTVFLLTCAYMIMALLDWRTGTLPFILRLASVLGGILAVIMWLVLLSVVFHTARSAFSPLAACGYVLVCLGLLLPAIAIYADGLLPSSAAFLLLSLWLSAFIAPHMLRLDAKRLTEFEPR